MIIAIFSDSHDDWQNLKQFIDYCYQQKINTIIFCGDLANKETLEYLTANFSGQIFMVGGNADFFDGRDTKKYPNVTYEEKILRCKVDQQKIIAVHKPKELEEILATTNEYFDFAFCGHTHRPDMKKKRQTIIANPGTLYGPISQASFAVLDTKTKKLELKILSLI